MSSETPPDTLSLYPRALQVFNLLSHRDEMDSKSYIEPTPVLAPEGFIVHLSPWTLAPSRLGVYIPPPPTHLLRHGSHRYFHVRSIFAHRRHKPGVRLLILYQLTNWWESTYLYDLADEEVWDWDFNAMVASAFSSVNIAGKGRRGMKEDLRGATGQRYVWMAHQRLAKDLRVCMSLTNKLVS